MAINQDSWNPRAPPAESRGSARSYTNATIDSKFYSSSSDTWTGVPWAIGVFTWGSSPPERLKTTGLMQLVALSVRLIDTATFAGYSVFISTPKMAGRQTVGNFHCSFGINQLIKAFNLLILDENFWEWLQYGKRGEHATSKNALWLWGMNGILLVLVNKRQIFLSTCENISFIDREWQSLFVLLLTISLVSVVCHCWELEQVGPSDLSYVPNCVWKKGAQISVKCR